MIAEMVIGIAKYHVEGDSAIELANVLFDINTPLENEIYNVSPVMELFFPSWGIVV